VTEIDIADFILSIVCMILKRKGKAQAALNLAYPVLVNIKTM
jgi:hypothetical protein